MAIDKIIAPALLNFAGNPIIVEARTDMSVSGTEYSFLRIVCEVNVYTEPYRDVPTFSMELSQPVSDKGTATFNLSDAAQSVVLSAQNKINMNESPANEGGSVTNYYNAGRRYYVQAFVYDVYIRDNYEVKSDKELVMPEENQSFIYVIPGKLNDFEMLSMGGFYLADKVKGRMMSRKPDMGMVYKGETIIVPVIGDGSFSKKLTVSVDGTKTNEVSESFKLYYLSYQEATMSHASDGGITVSSDLGGIKTGHYRTNTNGVHFLRFINGFGAVENISVRSKDKLSYEVSGETHSLVQGVTTRPTDRRYAVKSQPVGVYELSSGYVPQKWAEWYVQELLTSPRVWIQLGGKWVPALIEAEDDCVIYDRSKPEMPHVDFTLRLAIDGVTGVAW